MALKITVNKDSIADFCQKNHITKLSFFGSVLRDDFRPDSDVDVLVEFEAEHIPGFIRLHRIEQELSSLLDGHKPDLVTVGFLNRRMREKVLAESEVQYGQG